MNVPPVLQVNQQLLLQLSSKLSVHHSSFMILIKQLAGFFFFFSLNYTFMLPTWSRELLSLLYLTYITLCAPQQALKARRASLKTSGKALDSL